MFAFYSLADPTPQFLNSFFQKLNLYWFSMLSTLEIEKNAFSKYFPQERYWYFTGSNVQKSWAERCQDQLWINELKPRNIEEQGMAQWWERLPPTNVAWVQIPVSTPYVSWDCCWFSPLLWEVFLRVLRFSPLLKSQHFQIPIRSGIG